MSVTKSAAVERLLDLVAFLLAQKRPVPLRRIFEDLADLYAGSPEAAERKFTRDKEELRGLGANILWHESRDDDEEGGYTIDRASFYLPDVAFTPAERAALFAVGAAAQAGAFPLRSELAHALVKLRAASDDDDRAAPPVYSTQRTQSPFADLLARATTERRRVVLRYGGAPEPRQVDPYAFVVRRGRSTVVGFCHLRQAVRTFHVDRVTRCELANPDARKAEFDLPPDFSAADHLPTHPWQVKLHEPVAVELSFAPELAESGPRALGLAGATCHTTNLEGLIAQVLALGPGARIVGPESARARVREMLEAAR